VRLPFVPVEDPMNRPPALLNDLTRNLHKVFNELFEFHSQQCLSFGGVLLLPARRHRQQQQQRGPCSIDE